MYAVEAICVALCDRPLSRIASSFIAIQFEHRRQAISEWERHEHNNTTKQSSYLLVQGVLNHMQVTESDLQRSSHIPLSSFFVDSKEHCYPGEVIGAL